MSKQKDARKFVTKSTTIDNGESDEDESSKDDGAEAPNNATSEAPSATSSPAPSSTTPPLSGTGVSSPISPIPSSNLQLQSQPQPPITKKAAAPVEASTPPATPTAGVPASTICIAAEDTRQKNEEEAETPATKAAPSSASSKPVDADVVSSLKLQKNTPGKPKESIFEMKNPNLRALDKDYLKELIEKKEEFEKFKKLHSTCITHEEQLLKNQKNKDLERKKLADKYSRDFFKKHKICREDKIRGQIPFDSWSESKRYGETDPMKYTDRRVESMKHFAVLWDRMHRKGVMFADDEGTIEFKKETITPSENFVIQGQKWVYVLPIFGFMDKHDTRIQFSLINITKHEMEVKIRINGAENFKLIPKLGRLEPLSSADFQLVFLKKFRMKEFESRLSIYFNIKEDMDKMRKEFGAKKIDITTHFAGKMVVPVFIYNWECRHPLKPNELTDVAKEYERKAKVYARFARNHYKEYQNGAVRGDRQLQEGDQKKAKKGAAATTTREDDDDPKKKKKDGKKKAEDENRKFGLSQNDFDPHDNVKDDVELDGEEEEEDGGKNRKKKDGKKKCTLKEADRKVPPSSQLDSDPYHNNGDEEEEGKGNGKKKDKKKKGEKEGKKNAGAAKKKASSTQNQIKATSNVSFEVNGNPSVVSREAPNDRPKNKKT